ncbi:MAG: DNA-binding protein WhiA [Clostridia bacterium]|nr:DNA-binding protein WhiA [Clostridia bacterium]
MLNFTMEIKREIMAKSPSKKCCKDAFLTAFLLTNGSPVQKEGRRGFEIVTETELSAEYFLSLLEDTHGVTMQIKSIDTSRLRGRGRFVFESVGEDAERCLRDLGFLDGRRADFEKIRTYDECCRLSFLKGLFLGAGSCTLPSGESGKKTGYHLEFAFSDRALSEVCLEFLEGFFIPFKRISRKGVEVLYIQIREGIADFLNLVSAKRCLAKLNALVEERELVNLDTRANNCFLYNVDRTAAISAQQCRLIEIIDEKIGLEELSRDLRDTANMRLAYPMDNYQALADRLGITKSSLSRRLKHLVNLGKKLTEDRT